MCEALRHTMRRGRRGSALGSSPDAGRKQGCYGGEAARSMRQFLGQNVIQGQLVHTILILCHFCLKMLSLVELVKKKTALKLHLEEM